MFNGEIVQAHLLGFLRDVVACDSGLVARDDVSGISGVGYERSNKLHVDENASC